VRRIGVLASGSGTILRAMLDAGLPIAVVLVDRPCGATAIAESGGVPVEIVARGSYGPDFDRVAYTHEVVDALGRRGERQLGLQEIPLDQIVGSVDKVRDFDRRFRPTTGRVRNCSIARLRSGRPSTASTALSPTA